MTETWAVTADAGQVDAAGRAALAGEMVRWVDTGGVGVALITCHRAELYGFDRVPALEAPRLLTGDQATTHLMRVACGLESVIVGDGLPPIVDISAPSAVSEAVRARMNGSFLGIDDLYRHGGPLPGAYIKEAERLVGQKTAEYTAWLRRVS